MVASVPGCPMGRTAMVASIAGCLMGRSRPMRSGPVTEFVFARHQMTRFFQRQFPPKDLCILAGSNGVAAQQTSHVGASVMVCAQHALHIWSSVSRSSGIAVPGGSTISSFGSRAGFIVSIIAGRWRVLGSRHVQITCGSSLRHATVL